MLSAPSPRLTQVVVHSACLLPFLWLLYAGWQNHLGANPIEYITHFTGDWTLRMLLIVLLFRPLAHLSHAPWILRYRRAVGLYCFFYACNHLMTYLWLDQFFDWQEIVVDILERPFIFVGFAAFLLLVPLAATSNNWAVRKLQNRWRTLHRLVYLIPILGLIHYWWLIRADYLQAWIYLIMLATLLGYRLVRFISQARAYGV